MRIWLLLTVFSLTACGSPPLIRPETSPSQGAVTSTPVTTVEISGETLTSSSTQEPTKENLTPSGTRIAISASSVTVGGYTFSLPQEVPDRLGPVSIIGWLPDSPNEIVAIAGYQIIAIDVYSGRVRKFSQSFEFPITPTQVRLLKHDQVAFFTYDPQLEQDANFWISGADDEQAQKPVVHEAYLSPLVAPDQEHLILYNTKTQQARTFTQAGDTVEAQATSLPALVSLAEPQPSGENRVVRIQSASSPASRWTAVYNEERFSLIDLKTGETKPVDLKAGEARASDIGYSARAAYWSDDGKRLAILVTEGPDPISFMKVFVLDVESGQAREIVTDFQYVTNVTWDPDSQHLLFIAESGKTALTPKGGEYNIAQLFLVNVVSNKTHLVPILPETTISNFIWKLSWAPDGKKIALGASFAPPGNSHLYRIDVYKP